jgi:hypothetical protein
VTFESSISAGNAQSTYTLPRNISAIQVLSGAEGGMRMGTILQLPAGTQVRVCGDGFNERTVKVSWEGGYYFLFFEDLEPERAFTAKTYAGR